MTELYYEEKPVQWWVQSWLENYIKAENMDKVVEAVKPYVGEK